ncbi:MAG: hypothetical protein FJ051_06240 [Cyanobacteria bacterium M_surface_9_m1_291]|nr:hypothetical protein [Cyanobacteria bacterium K_Offshore_0m_m2_072]MBM5809402.1 hypothetical protein [Cyanobacteria bacterium M_surface_9_m1_291]
MAPLFPHRPSRLADDSFQQHRTRPRACQGVGNTNPAMSITHCPLCIGLAVLSAVRFMGHAVLVWGLMPQPEPVQPLRPATVPG